MTLGNKLSKLRKENNYTQEQLAEILGVSRQAISKWESDIAYPETEKIIRLGELYDCSLDYLLKENIEEKEKKNTEKEKFPEETPKENTRKLRDYYFEKKSEKMVGGIPLWHINIGIGRCAKGIFALGLAAKGVVAIGLLSLGIISIGFLSLGIISLGYLVAGLAAAGSFAAGIVSFGAISIGIVSYGAIAIGEFSVGALAIGHYYGEGDVAKAMIAIGQSEAEGSLYQFLGKPDREQKAQIWQMLYDIVPGVYKWFVGKML